MDAHDRGRTSLLLTSWSLHLLINTRRFYVDESRDAHGKLARAVSSAALSCRPLCLVSLRLHHSRKYKRTKLNANKLTCLFSLDVRTRFAQDALGQDTSNPGT